MGVERVLEGATGEQVALEAGCSVSTISRWRREARALYGLKFRLSEQESWIPESSFIVQAFTLAILVGCSSSGNRTIPAQSSPTTNDEVPPTTCADGVIVLEAGVDKACASIGGRVVV